MKKLAVALLFCGVSAFAATVNYSTAGVFTSTGTNTVTNNGVTISFAGAPATQANAAGTFTNVGVFTTTDPGGTVGTFTDMFTLTITQTQPVGTGSFVSSIVNGEISSNGSNISLSWTPTSMNINGAEWLFTTTNINQPAAGNQPGVTTVQEFVSAPEPTSLGLLGLSLAGLGIAFRRRRAA